MSADVVRFPRTPDERLARAARPFADDLAEKMAARGTTRACISVGLAIEGRRTTAAFGDRGVRAKLERLGRCVLDGRNPKAGAWVLVVTEERCAWLPLAEIVGEGGGS